MVNGRKNELTIVCAESIVLLITSSADSLPLRLFATAVSRPSFVETMVAWSCVMMFVMSSLHCNMADNGFL